MKFLKILIISLIFQSYFCSISTKFKRKSQKLYIKKFQNKLKHNLTSKPPSGITLKDHFGIQANHSPYGPMPTLLKQKVEVKFDDDDAEKSNQILQNQLLIHIRNKECNIEKIRGWEFCFVLNSCDTCTSASNCGWCSQSQRCLPGNLTNSACSNYCHRGWKFRRELCKNNSIDNDGVVSGELKGNCETTKLKKVQLTPPKVRIRTKILDKQVIHTPVLLGNVKLTKSVNYSDRNNKTIFTKNYEIVQPLLGEIHSYQDVETDHQQIIDLETGKQIPDESKVLEYHGIN